MITPAPPAADLDRLIDAIIDDIQSAWCHLRAGASERLRRSGISMAHMHALWLLADHGPMTMSRIAEALDVSDSNATGLIDRMEERGLVERVRVPDDRRVVLVRVAPGGEAAIDTMELFKRDRIARVLRRLTPDQLARVQRTLEDIRDAYAAAQEAPDR